MNAQQYTDLLYRVGNGEGVEAILASMGIDSNVGTQWLKDHPSARGDIAAAKASGVTAKSVMDSDGRARL